MLESIYNFLAFFIISLFILFISIFSYYYFWGSDYLVEIRMFAVFIDSIISFDYYFSTIFVFSIVFYFAFINPGQLQATVKKYPTYLISNFKGFIFIFLLIGIIFSFISNRIMPNVLQHSNKINYTYKKILSLKERVASLTKQVDKINRELSNSFSELSRETQNNLINKKKLLKDIIRDYEEILVIYPKDEDALMNLYFLYSEYEKMPQELTALKMEMKEEMIKVKSLTEIDFLNIINSNIKVKNYYTANYFSYIAYVIYKKTNFRELFEETWEFLNSEKNVSSKMSEEYFSKKQKNFIYLQSRDFKKAYYGFRELERENADDLEINDYIKQAERELKREYLFIDELELYFQGYGFSSLFLIKKEESTNLVHYIYIDKLVEYPLNSRIKLLKAFEILTLNSDGIVVNHFVLPFATLIKNNDRDNIYTVYNNILDKKSEDSPLLREKILKRNPNINYASLKVIELEIIGKTLPIFSNLSNLKYTLSIKDFFEVLPKIKVYNIQVINSLSKSFYKFVYPFYLLILGLFFLYLAFILRVKSSYNFLNYLYVVPLFFSLHIIIIFLTFLLISSIALLIYFFSNTVLLITILFLIFLILMLTLYLNSYYRKPMN